MSTSATGVWSLPDLGNLDTTPVQLTELLHPAMAAAGVGAWRYDHKQKIFFFDELLRTRYELPAAGALKAEQILERIHPEDRDAWLAIFGSSATQRDLRSRHRVVLEDGQMRWFDWTGSCSAGESGIFLGVCIDVSAEILAQEKLQVGEERLRAIASGVPGKFAYMDRNRLVQFLSKETCDSLGIELASAIGRHISDVFGSKDEPTQRHTHENFGLALNGEETTFEDTPVRADGSLGADLVTYRPDYDSNGNVRGVFTLRVDISDRRQLEDSLREVSDDLMRSNGDLEQFAYVASHDLKAPLRAIQVLVEWLQEDLADYQEGDVQENLQLLSKRSMRLNKLLEDLLSYSRVGRKTLPPETIELGELVDEIADLIDADSGISVSMHGEPVTLSCDPAAINLVLRNLIGNAVKHHPGPSGSVQVYTEDHEAHHVICVADDGAGIPEEFSAKVFKMFQTLKPRDEVEGSGMGLAIVERTIQNQGGKIWFEPAEDGTGTVFKFTWMKNHGENEEEGQQ